MIIPTLKSLNTPESMVSYGVDTWFLGYNPMGLRPIDPRVLALARDFGIEDPRELPVTS